LRKQVEHEGAEVARVDELQRTFRRRRDDRGVATIAEQFRVAQT
jgi:hypothetical protein